MLIRLLQVRDKENQLVQQCLIVRGTEIELCAEGAKPWQVFNHSLTHPNHFRLLGWWSRCACVTALDETGDFAFHPLTILRFVHVVLPTPAVYFFHTAQHHFADVNRGLARVCFLDALGDTPDRF
jgi:hypothetical protein